MHSLQHLQKVYQPARTCMTIVTSLTISSRLYVLGQDASSSEILAILHWTKKAAKREKLDHKALGRADYESPTN